MEIFFKWLFYIIFNLILKDSLAETSSSSASPDYEQEKDLEIDFRPNIFLSTNQHGRKHVHLKGHFSYGSSPEGPVNWPSLFKDCGGKNQSPIDIDIFRLKNVNFDTLKWSNGYNEMPDDLTIENNLHTVVVNCSDQQQSNLKIESGPLNHPYMMDQLHFHWGSNDHKGSEHTLGKHSYPMEMHVVHHRSDMSFDQAASEPDGLAVIGYFFQIIKKDNPALAPIIETLKGVKERPHKLVKIHTQFKFNSLIQPFYAEYVTYRGSLTTPPCAESVIWLLSPYTIDISKKQLKEFRSLFSVYREMTNNYRPTQPINDRSVYFVNTY